MKNSSIYKQYGIEELNEHFSNYLMDSWSYSKISSFARNEKAFEMEYIFGLRGKSSSTTVAGSAYHKALDFFFTQLKDGVNVDLVEMEQAAFEYIDDVKPNFWKLSKTLPTVEECRIKAIATSNALLKNFVTEQAVYLEDLAEVLEVEAFCEEFVTINGVDIPLPLHAKIDLVIRTKSGKVVVIDHKSKQSFTPDDEIAMAIGRQAIAYSKAYEEKTGTNVDEVWFVENKFSQNKDKSPKLNAFKVTLDEDTRKLYEALLYEPLRRMIEAISNPDYLYIINESDNLIDKAELYDFWCRTMICEVEDFNVEEAKKELVAKRLKKVRDASVKMVTPSVIRNFKENASKFIQYDLSTKDMTNEQKIEHILRSFGIPVQVAHTKEGYSCNIYLLEVSAGVKIASIYSRRLDLASALNVSSVRLSSDLVVYDGKSYLAVECSKKREFDLLFDPAALSSQRIPLGKDNYGNTIVWDWNNHSTPHALICGATGSGKSELVKTVIEYAFLAEVDNIVIFDPKHEFGHYQYGNGNVIVVNDILEIEEHMAKLVEYMEDLVKTGKKKKTLVIFDEFADAVANSRSGNQLKIYENKLDGLYANGSERRKRVCTGELKSLEENMRILLQKGRSSGFRILAATQRASTKVITGDAKVNFPVLVCFRVPKETDSRVVLDEPGAESLAGYGDGLIKSPEYPQVIRFQAFYKPKHDHQPV